MLSTDKAWEKFGRENPYYGVLAEERFTAPQIGDNRDAFFESGRAFVAGLLRRYESHFGAVPRGSALDHGCGVGRLTLPLGAGFEQVTGLDVSPSMLAEAKANAERLDVANVEFELADDRLSNAAGQFDFVNSYITLQHIPVRRGLSILARLVERVRPGGGIHVHVSIRTDGLPSRALWWASHHIPGVKIWQNICAGRRWNAPAMQMNDYPMSEVIVALASGGVSEFLVATEQHAKFLTVSVIGKRREA
ncbi:class I SAM-dependent methyltransferase [Sphingomonas daechungensis]|uniref:class I SAM-dependent methyltransferase n=1 Tax=Sphingomonas daechungensis TaxID=1176646 RepID=UPI0031EB621A